MKPKKDFENGARAAAGIAADYATTHEYRLDDCILMKLNLIRRAKPRRNNRKVEPAENAWTRGCATALAEIHALLAGGNDSSGVRSVAKTSGITIANAKSAGCSTFTLRELKKAGIT